MLLILLTGIITGYFHKRRRPVRSWNRRHNVSDMGSEDWRLKVEDLHTGVWDLLGYEVVWDGDWIRPLDLRSPETSVVTYAEDLTPHVWYLDRVHTILTSRALTWCYVCSWDVRSDLTLNSMAQIHTSVNLLTWRDLAWSSGRLTCQHASQISAVAHIPETWRTCRALFRHYQLFPEIEEMLTEKVRQRTFLYDTKSPDYRD
jgi:hypothetical protein